MDLDNYLRRLEYRLTSRSFRIRPRTEFKSAASDIHAHHEREVAQPPLIEPEQQL